MRHNGVGWIVGDDKEGNFHKKETVRLPSDEEERRALKKGKNYVKIRSGRVKTYTQKEIDALEHPELAFPFAIWFAERKWNWLINSKGCRLGGGS